MIILLDLFFLGSLSSLLLDHVSPYVSDVLWLMVFLDTLSPLTVECICCLPSYQISSESSSILSS
uniref:Uncharacterized protein n=1 Tax=Zea mays TaxID=4577 RepID=B4FPP7_MAIZE|nr:unknown [Zea mays]